MKRRTNNSLHSLDLKQKIAKFKELQGKQIILISTSIRHLMTNSVLDKPVNLLDERVLTLLLMNDCLVKNAISNLGETVFLHHFYELYGCESVSEFNAYLKVANAALQLVVDDPKHHELVEKCAAVLLANSN